MRKTVLAPLVTGLLLTACATMPSGPSVMVLPGTGKSFEQFLTDDAVCRQWAAQSTGVTTTQASAASGVGSAAVGTVVGAAAGAAIGAAAGSPATGAAAGAGVGLLGGTAVGASRAEGSSYEVQQRYDIAYMQCMYAKGNQIPVPGGSQRPPTSTWQRPEAPPRGSPPVGVPPPPAGSPPPPPPGPAW